MKKILLIMLIAMSAMSALAQTPVDVFVESVKARAPYEMTEGLNVVGAEATDDGLMVTYDVSDDMYAALPGVMDILHDALVAELVTSEKDRTTALRRYIKENDLKVVHRMRSSSGEYCDIVLLPSEL